MGPKVSRGRWRVAGVLLTLVSHLMLTIGFPLSAPRCGRKDTSVPFPCQHRPCGCLTAEQCWRGDCCCFTLEEKLAWAEANGVEPPKHVRTQVAARRKCSLAPGQKCGGSQTNATSAHDGSCYGCIASPAQQERNGDHSCSPSVSAANTHCSACAQKIHTCCTAKPCCDSKPCCTAKTCCDSKRPTKAASASGMRWVVGFFAAKCRGQGPFGWWPCHLILLLDLTPIALSEPELAYILPFSSDRIHGRKYPPPLPPPRLAADCLN